MTRTVDVSDVRQWLADGREIAFLDVREQGQYGSGHPFFAIPCAFSGFEPRLVEIVPRRATRMVLFDDGDGVADRAAARAEALGYTDVAVMRGGAPAWGAAGYTLYEGVHLPSKTFGEVLEIERHTPRMSAEDVAALAKDGANHVIVDGRPYAEYTKFNIPGGICCPNGELALRIKEIAPDPATTIIVNCAGRTRSILGAQTLIDFGVPNPVYALENGTQGWFLSGLEREEGASRSYPQAPKGAAELAALRGKAKARAEATGVAYIAAAQAALWLADGNRTTYLFDVRTDEEYGTDAVPGSRHAPGGQLVQTTDLWIGVRGARIIVMDSDMIRAPMVAHWLYQLGHDVAILDGGVEAARAISVPPIEVFEPEPVAAITPADLAAKRDGGGLEVVDLRASADYRAAHIAGARWSIRPRLGDLGLAPDSTVVLVVDDAATAALARETLATMSVRDVTHLGGSIADWQAAGLEVVATPGDPPDCDRIDFLFHTVGRNAGSVEDAKAYLAWEIGLVDQLDAHERAGFRLAAG